MNSFFSSPFHLQKRFSTTEEFFFLKICAILLQTHTHEREAIIFLLTETNGPQKNIKERQTESR